MIHPEWYYKYYNKIFGTRKYFSEISIINNLSPFYGKSVLEIGAGTGMHAEHILAFKPQKLSLDLGLGYDH